MKPSAHLPAKAKALLILAKNRNQFFHMKISVSLKYFVNGCLWKQFFAFNSLQNPSNVMTLTILVTLRLFAQFQPKTRVIKLQESAKICLTF